MRAQRTPAAAMLYLAVALMYPVLPEIGEMAAAPLEQRIVLVAGDRPWSRTDIEIHAQDRIVFRANGKVCFSGDARLSCLGPSGWDRSDYPISWPEDNRQCADPLPKENHAALIGDIGGSRFYIGAAASVSNRSGTLRLGINDCTFAGEYGNSGEYSVVIVIMEGQSPMSPGK